MGELSPGRRPDGVGKNLPRSLDMLGDIDAAVAQLPENSRRLHDSQEHDRNRRRVEIAADLTLFLAALHYISDTFQVAPDDVVYSGFSFAAAAEDLLGENDAWNPLVLPYQLGMQHQQPPQAFNRILAFSRNFLDVFCEPVADQIQDGIQQFILAAEVAVHRRRHHADTVRDSGYAETVQTVRGDQSQSSLRELVLPDFSVEFYRHL